MLIHIISIFFFSIDFSVILLYVSLKYQLFLIVLITRGTPIILITMCTSFCNDRDEEFSYLLAYARNWDKEHEHYQRKIGIYFDSGYNWKNKFSYILKYWVLWSYVLLLYNAGASRLFLFCFHYFLKKNWKSAGTFDYIDLIIIALFSQRVLRSAALMLLCT